MTGWRARRRRESSGEDESWLGTPSWSPPDRGRNPCGDFDPIMPQAGSAPPPIGGRWKGVSGKEAGLRPLVADLVGLLVAHEAGQGLEVGIAAGGQDDLEIGVEIAIAIEALALETQ